MSKLNPKYDFKAMSDTELKNTLDENKIALTLDEARKVQDILGREVTLTEAIIWGIQGSEHCSYRSTRPFLRNLPTQGRHVILGPAEDAGIIEIAEVNGRKYGIVMAHESHNHPSQVVPYEGAATGIGGITRDVLCMGAKVVATADPLRFGDINRAQTKQIAHGVVAGIEGYGNPIGVPNIAGDVYFNQDYNDNCLVNVVCLGLLAEDEIIHSYAPKGAGEGNYSIITIGKPTDMSGFGGAAFSSLELNEEDKEANKGAVQEPNPFLKKHLFAATYALFAKLKEKNLISKVGFKDMGAGGNVCSSVEQVEPAGYGAIIDLEKIPVAIEGLNPAVIACSETQERLLWIVPPEIEQMVLDHYNIEWDLPDVAKGARAAVIGKVIEEDKYVLLYKGEEVCHARPCDITEGLLYDREHTPTEINQTDEGAELSDEQIVDAIKKILAHENVASRKPVYENYDKNVQGITVIEPGHADAGLIAPLLNRPELDGHEAQKVGIALSVDANPRYGRISAKHQAALAVVEGMRNVAAVGATPWCITDCLNYGNPEQADQMQEIVDGIEGVGEALRVIGHKINIGEPVPCISGNVSLYNFSKNRSIPPSAIIGMLGHMKNYEKAITMDMKDEKSTLYLIGKRKKELGGSVLFDILGKPLDAGQLPSLDYDAARSEIFGLIDAIDQGLVLAAHDISDGGMVTALLEMLIIAETELGAELELPTESIGLTLAEKLFSETGGFVCQIADEHAEEFETLMKAAGATANIIGHVKRKSTEVKINDIKLDIQELAPLFNDGLRNKL